MNKIPKSHPRYLSLVIREKIVNGIKNGIVHETGLIAHGRGEAFDYLIGEKTIKYADIAEKTAAAALLCAKNPVISVNGNVVALVPKECINLANSIPAKLEINLFHRTNERLEKITELLKKFGAEQVYGNSGDAKIPGLNHNRGICDKKGIFSSDVILVPLEDGDRCKALKGMSKKVITIDLNPLSRTAKNADITIVDNVIRAVPNIERWVDKLRQEDRKKLQKIIDMWNNNKMLEKVYSFISKRLNSLL